MGARRQASKSEILLALTEGRETPTLGNIWRITGKSADFYLDTVGPRGDLMHISLHGPKPGRADHRFHLKVPRDGVNKARSAGHYVEHQVPARGMVFQGRQIEEDVFHVVRLRWRWHLQKPKYRDAAVIGPTPPIRDGRTGMVSRDTLLPNSAWDVDIYISYGRPYWPNRIGITRGDPRIGPVRNDVGMYLTAVSSHRLESRYPSPRGVVPRLPRAGETPTSLTCGALGDEGERDFYWFVETITARELLKVGG